MASFATEPALLADRACAFVRAAGAVFVLGNIAWNLLHCFAGYLLVRLELVIFGLAGGAALGAFGIGLLVEQPSTADLLMAGGAGAVLLGLAGWFFYRVFAACYGAGIVGCLFYGLLIRWGTQHWKPVIVFGGLVAIIIGVLVFLRARFLLMLGTAVAGGLGTVFSLALALVFGPGCLGADPPPDLASRWNLWLSLLPVGLGLAAFGMLVQLRLWRRLRPPAKKPDDAGAKTDSTKKAKAA